MARIVASRMERGRDVEVFLRTASPVAARELIEQLAFGGELELIDPEEALGSAERKLRRRDEILQVLFWMRGEQLAEEVRPEDLRVFLDPRAVGEGLVEAFEELTEKGLVERTGEGTYRLTEEGILAGGRRFADEFADLTGQAHGECNDPDCACHEDPEAVEEFCERHGLEIVAEVPYDRTLIDAERSGRAPVDYDPASPAVMAVRELAAKVV